MENNFANAENWTSKNINEVAFFFRSHQNHPAFGTFLDLHPNREGRPYNKVVRAIVHNWYRLQMDGFGYVYGMQALIPEEEIFQIYAKHIIETKFEDWDAEKVKFTTWLRMGLKEHGCLGAEVVAAGKPFKQVKVNEWILSIEAMKERDEDGNGTELDKNLENQRPNDIESPSLNTCSVSALGLTKMEAEILDLAYRFRTNKSTDLALMKYLNREFANRGICFKTKKMMNGFIEGIKKKVTDVMSEEEAGRLING